MRYFLPALVVLLATGTAACSHADGAPLDACTLISAQRASAILGTPVTRRPVGPKPTRADQGSVCMYSTGAVGGGFMLIAARTGFADAGSEAKSQMALARRDRPPPGVPAIRVHASDGPGQAAWLGTSEGSTQLHVLDHGVALVVAISQAPSPAVRARARRLALAALDGLRK